MNQKEEFFEYINVGCIIKGDCIELGKETITNAIVKIPLKSLNRDGLIAGTGKIKI